MELKRSKRGKKRHKKFISSSHCDVMTPRHNMTKLISMKTIAHVVPFGPRHSDVAERFEEFKPAHRDVIGNPPTIFSPFFVKLEAQPWDIKGKNPNLEKRVLRFIRR